MSWEYPWMGLWLIGWMAGVGCAWWGHHQLRLEQASWHALGTPWTHAVDTRRFRRTMIVWLMASLLMILGGMGPRWSFTPNAPPPTTTPEGLAIVIDTSLSMAAQDVAPSRLHMAIAWAKAEVSHCEPCWIGLGTFEGIWDPIIPLTHDRALLLMAMDTLRTEQLPIPGSELANAVDVGIGLLAHYPGPKRMVIVSDGETHGTAYRDSLQDALARGIRIDTVGIGTTTPTPMPTPNGPDPWKRTPERDVALTRFQSDPLRHLAHQTGGRYRHHTVPPLASPPPRPAPPRLASLSFGWVLGLGIIGVMIGVKWP